MNDYLFGIQPYFIMGLIAVIVAVVIMGIKGISDYFKNRGK